MKTRFESVVMVIGICAAVLFFANSINAEVDVYQDLVNSGVPAEVVDDLFSGSADTLGQRAETMLENGTLTQRQYDTIYNRVTTLPESQRQHMKDAYDQGAAPKLYEGATGTAHRKLGGDLEDKYDELYDAERFEAADTDNDGVLNKNELRAEQKDFEYYQDNRRFQHADTNNDGVISREETKAEKKWEKQHREKLAKDTYKHRDRREDIKDRREDIRDRKEDIRDRKEDVLDRREDIKDRREDVLDKKEDVWDRRHEGGRKDKLEDIRDRKEDVRDRKEDVRDRREDVVDRREDIRDRREDIRDKKEDIRDRGLHKGYEKGVRDHGKGIGKGKGQGAANRRR